MSKKPQGINIPWALIILGFVFAWPIGLVLCLLRVLPVFSSSQSTDSTTTHQSTDQSAQQRNQEHQNTVHTASQNSVYSAGRGYTNVQHTNAAANSKKQATTKIKKSSAEKFLRFLSVVLIAVGVIAGISNISDFLSGEHFFLEDWLFALCSIIGGCLSWETSNFLKKRDRDYIRYAALIGNKDSISLMKLSSATSYKIAKIKRDLQRMIDNGMFGDLAYIDMSNLCFMRTPDAVPDGVAEASNSALHSMGGVAKDFGSKQVNNNDSSNTVSNSSELELSISDFDSILRKIRQLDDDIRDEVVSQRIRTIETITRNIFECVQNKPEKMKNIRMFMNYYLPTTLKLLESYSQIERVGVAGQNMRDAKDNIEKILNMLVAGFQQQLDQLFKEENLDISSDINVLEQMMAKDGLMQNRDFTVSSDTPFESEFSDDISDDWGEEGGAAAENKKQL